MKLNIGDFGWTLILTPNENKLGIEFSAHQIMALENGSKPMYEKFDWHSFTDTTTDITSACPQVSGSVG